jgi:hypothetical protein
MAEYIDRGIFYGDLTYNTRVHGSLYGAKSCMSQCPTQLRDLHNDVTSSRMTSLDTVHRLQHVIRDINLMQLFLRQARHILARSTCTHFL